MTETASKSLCKMDCSLRLSHLRVTPAQVLSVTMPWSFLSLRQQTRAPTWSNLDWAEVDSAEANLKFAQEERIRYDKLMKSGSGSVQRAQQTDAAFRAQSAQLQQASQV
jgi:multidrug resistance efflux pump